MDNFDRRWGAPYRGRRQVPFQSPASHPMQRPIPPMQRAIQPRGPAVPERPTQVPIQPRQAPIQPAVAAAPDRRAAATAQAGQADEVAALRREIERLTVMLAAANDENERQARALEEEKEHRARVPATAVLDTADEIERAKERLRKDASREIAQHKRDLVCDFIEVLDDLDRAVQAPQSAGGDAPGVLEGVELVRKSFRGKLAQHGVEHDPALGADFDPTRHEAVGVLPVVDLGKDGMIVAVVREGYRMGDDVLRPARVVVARAS